MTPNVHYRSEVRGQRSEQTRRVVVAVAVALVAASAQTGRAQPAAAPDSQALSVFLMTMGPGDAVWERFGHNAIRIHNAATAEDRVYNWGMFSLDESGFILRFLRGRMRYWMASEDAVQTINAYRQYNRSVTLQELNLTGAQKLVLYAFVKRNELPENRFYDYDYFRDNCSTRVRDALDAALGGILRSRYKDQQTEQTFRGHARRLMQPDIWTYSGIDIGLGRPTDRRITSWEEMFIPMSLQRLVRDVRVRGAGGQDAPLVLSEHVVFEAARPPIPERPAPWTLRYLLIGCVLGIVVLVCGLTRAAPVATFISVVWSIAAGILGLLLVFLWTATAHVAAYQNANLLPLNPAWLALAWLTIARSRKARTLAVWLTVAGFAALLLRLLPNQQDTSRVLALVLPVHLGVMVAVARRVRLSRA
ncbi:MAG: Lnb N-terminal periplasmic domain-containing protein [Gemmatimonadaceae bacterium]